MSQAIASNNHEPQRAGSVESKRAARIARLVAQYQLERDPFSGQGMSGLFFGGGERKNLVEALLHFSRYGSAPQFLSGPPGSGKSTLLREFAQRAERDIDIALLRVDMLASGERCLDLILQAFAIVDYSQAAAFDRLYTWLKGQATRGRHAILCIDDVQHLDANLLRQLLSLVADAELSFKLVFAGEIDARPRLESAVEAQGMLCNSMELTELNPAQVGDYAMYLLESAGYRGELPLSNMQLQAAAARSHGSLAQLNELLRDLLVASAEGRAPETRSSRFPLANLLVAAGLAAITAYFGWRSLDKPAPAIAPPIALEKVEAVAPATPPPDTTGAADSASKVTEVEAVLRDAAVAANAPTDGQQSPDQQEPASEPVTPDAAAAGSNSAQRRGAVAADEPSAPADSDAARVAERRAGEQRVEPVEDAEQVTASVALARASVGTAEDSPADATGTAAPQKQQLNKVFKRLQSWPDEGYALQVFGTHNEARARKLVEQYFGEADLLFYETRHNGKPWFVVINGPYSGRQTAREGIESLPESLRRLRPWPRNVASIKSDLSRFDALLGISQ